MNVSSIYVGDTLQYSVTVPEYPASVGYVLKYRFAPIAAGTAFTVTASASGDDYAVNVSAATTAAWTAGDYTWSSWVELGAARYTVGQGYVTLLPNPATATAGTDNRSTARKILAAIESLLLGFTDVAEYTIGDVSIKRMSREQLLAARRDLKAEVAGEEAAERIANGQAVPNKLRVRF